MKPLDRETLKEISAHPPDPGLASMEQLLTMGGDGRIIPDPKSGTNKYGCPPRIEADLLAFGSSTASVISRTAFHAADQLRQRLTGREDQLSRSREEMDRMRQELVRLCEVGDLAGLDVIFAASGTDLHLIASQLLPRGDKGLQVIIAGMEETGSGVPLAVAGRHFSTRSALGQAVRQGVSIGIEDREITVSAVATRTVSGMPRPAQAVDDEVSALARQAVAQGKQVLLVVVDVSKTGMVAPTPGCAIALRKQHPGAVHLMVDACQFRMTPATLRAYLEHGFMVALTGSKFLTGPTFAGALLIPGVVARSLRRRPFAPTFNAYCARADWPDDWTAADGLTTPVNLGLLLRWEAALAELRAFRQVPVQVVSRFLRRFAREIQAHLQQVPALEALAVPPLARTGLGVDGEWDGVQTIFPFLLRRPLTSDEGEFLTREDTLQIYQSLQADLSGRMPGIPEHMARLRCQLGQPVPCGSRDGLPVSALRMCASARLVVEAATGAGEEAVIADAKAALDKAAMLVQVMAPA